MTKRTLVVWCVVAAAMLSGASPAYAGFDDWWDYLDQLSGPGPFKGLPVLAATIGCRQDGAWQFSRAVSDPRRTDPCLYVDFRSLSVEPKGPYNKVTAKLV